MTASSLIGVDISTGEKVEEGQGGEPQEAAVNIHRMIHQMRYKIDGTIAAMHTHQPYTTTLGKIFRISLQMNAVYI